MTSREFRDRLAARGDKAGISIGTDAQGQLETYFQLLARWNAKINLTALPLQPPTSETFDRLLIEPLVAARYVADSAKAWFDVGSGGGSPAIPLKIAHPQARLTMIESKSRKVAFLREAVRTIGLLDTTVENDRIEKVAKAPGRRMVDLVTVRAVRPDPELLDAIYRLLSPNGRAFFFHSPGGGFAKSARLQLIETVSLGRAAASKLSIVAPVFHVEQNG